MKYLLAGLTLAAMVDGSALAADLRPKAPMVPAFDWSGFYLGGHFGTGGGSLGPNTNALPAQGVIFPPTVTGLIGGYQAGVNWQLANRVVLGAELDATFISPLDTARARAAPFDTTFDYFATARGRVGYAFGDWLPYVTGGLAWGRTKLNINDADGGAIATASRTSLGWTAGAGVEFAVGGPWTAKIEYAYLDLARQHYGLAGNGLPDVNGKSVV